MPRDAIELVGGRYDGALVTCDPGVVKHAVLLLVDDFRENEGFPLTPKGGCTAEFRRAAFYYPIDLEDDQGRYDGEGVYHRCADDLWRPAKLKACMGL